MIRLISAALFAAALAHGQIPRPAPDIEFAPVTGGSGKMRLSDFRGKVVVIEFLLTTCPGCKHSGAILARLQREYGPRGLQVIGLAVDFGSAARIPVFAAETRALFPIAAYSDASAREFLQAPLMLRMSYPQLVFIDRKGVLREHFRGEDPRMDMKAEEANIRKVIEQLLAEDGRPKKMPARKAR
ncbi:MAG: TlpA family protein disulfide reductase [Bryobacteraceae bacterium]|nr:TlpA family protein disulfide reductase [Bryobacteraceae bacterium]